MKNKVLEKITEKIIYNSKRLTESPEELVINGVYYDYSSQNAYAFIILKNSVAISKNTHPFIINCLNKISENNFNEYPKIAKIFEVKFRPKLTKEDIEFFESKYNPHEGENRENFISGRFWTPVKDEDNKKASVISFWANRNEISNKKLDFLISTFKFENRIYIEFLNSKKPYLYKKEENIEKIFKSQKYPYLSHDEIVKILIKSHTSPTKLSNFEREVANEFKIKKIPEPIEKRFYKYQGD